MEKIKIKRQINMGFSKKAKRVKLEVDAVKYDLLRSKGHNLTGLLKQTMDNTITDCIKDETITYDELRYIGIDPEPYFQAVHAPIGVYMSKEDVLLKKEDIEAIHTNVEKMMTVIEEIRNVFETSTLKVGYFKDINEEEWSTVDSIKNYKLFIVDKIYGILYIS